MRRHSSRIHRACLSSSSVYEVGFCFRLQHRAYGTKASVEWSMHSGFGYLFWFFIQFQKFSFRWRCFFVKRAQKNINILIRMVAVEAGKQTIKKGEDRNERPCEADTKAKWLFSKIKTNNFNKIFPFFSLHFRLVSCSRASSHRIQFTWKHSTVRCTKNETKNKVVRRSDKWIAEFKWLHAVREA